MHASLPLDVKQFSARRVRSDALALIFMGTFATAAAITLAVLKFQEVFVPGGIAWNLPVLPQTASGTGLTQYAPEGPAATVEVVGTLTHLQIVVPDVNTVSAACLGIAIVVAALTALTVIAYTMQLAWNFLRGDFFTRRTSRALRTLTWTGIVGGLIAYATWELGSNGVEAAVGALAAETGALAWWCWYTVMLFSVMAFGLVDIAFRRAARLQRDQEGLI